MTFAWIRSRIPSSASLHREAGGSYPGQCLDSDLVDAGEIANRHFRPLIVDGRLKPGVTIEQAQHEMDIIAADLARRFPDSNAGRTVRIVPLDTAIVDSRRTFAGAALRRSCGRCWRQSASSC